MITDEECRWSNAMYPKVPKSKGLVDDLDKFDAACFQANSKLAENMSSEGRVLLEKAYEAILDAGINPISLRGNFGIENFYEQNNIN